MLKPDSVEPASARQWEHLWLQAALLVTLVFLAYLPALSGGFIWDDDAYVTSNPLLTAPDGLKRIWFSTHSQSQYFPLVFTTLRLERWLWGLDPSGFHLVNVLLHSANALLVWGLLRRLAVPGAWLAGAIFALHPVQAETVAWITELKNTQSTFFYLLAVWAWLEFTDRTTVRPWRFYALALLLHLLALLSKTTACTLPAALLLVLWVRHERVCWRRWIQIVPFVLFGIGLGLVSVWWEAHLGNYTKVLHLNFAWPERLLVATRALWFYAAKLFWPAKLTFSYPRWEINPCDPLQYGWLLACIAIALLLWRQRKALGRGPTAAVLFFALALAPMLGFVSLYTFRYSFVADHYQYLACVGLIALFTGWACSPAVTRWLGPKVRYASGLFLLLVLGALTWRQAGIYQNLETLWSDTVAKNPQSWLAQVNLGACRVDEGRFDEAIQLFQKSLLLQPNEIAHNNLGWELVRQGKFEEALGHFHAALDIHPQYALAHCNLAITLQTLGRTGEALAHYREALRTDPLMLRALNNLAWTLATHPNPEFRDGAEAVRLAERACEATRYGFAQFVGTLAAAYAEAGRFDEAVATAEKAQALAQAMGDPGLAERNARLSELYRAGRPYRDTNSTSAPQTGR